MFSLKLQLKQIAMVATLGLWVSCAALTSVFVKTMTVTGQPVPVSKDLVGILIAGAAAGRRTATCADCPAAQDESPSFLSRRQPSA